MRRIFSKMPSSATLAIGAAVLAGLLLLPKLFFSSSQERTVEAPTPTFDVRVYTLPAPNGAEILYRAYTPVKKLSLTFPASGLEHLELVEGGENVSIVADGEGVALRGVEEFGLAGFILRNGLLSPEGEAPVAQFGTNATVLNMEAFQPVRVNGQLVKNAGVASRPFRWLGPEAEISNPKMQLFVDSAVPLPVASLLGPTSDLLADYFTDGFGRALPGTPDLMFLYEDGFEGQLGVQGDAVRSQTVIKYVGLGYRQASPEARRLVTFNLAHELAHMWQLENPGVGAAPEWLHEGMADALAAEALYVAGIWEDSDYAASLQGARSECADKLRAGPLQTLEAKGRHRAGYACGHMIAAAVAAQRSGGTVMSMWREFDATMQDTPEGMTADSFLRFVEGWTQSPDFTNSLRDFLQMDFRSADRLDIVDQLFAGTL